MSDEACERHEPCLGMVRGQDQVRGTFDDPSAAFLRELSDV